MLGIPLLIDWLCVANSKNWFSCELLCQSCIYMYLFQFSNFLFQSFFPFRPLVYLSYLIIGQPLPTKIINSSRTPVIVFLYLIISQCRDQSRNLPNIWYTILWGFYIIHMFTYLFYKIEPFNHGSKAVIYLKPIAYCFFYATMNI